MTIDYKKLAAQAAEIDDHNETKAGGGYEYVPPAAGVTIGRFIEYIELGAQPQRPFKGQEKPPILTARLTFELLANKNLRKAEIDGKERTFAERISFELPVMMSEKAKFKKLYMAMKYGRPDISHMSQMLNDEYVLTVFHDEVEKDGQKRVYVGLRDKDGSYAVKPPRIENPVEGTITPVPVPTAISPIKIFTWKNPTKETWASLEIEGTYTQKDAAGNEVEVSKNRLQEKILAAVDFQGSALEELLAGAEAVGEVIAEATAAPVVSTAKKAAPVAATKTATKSAAVKTKAAPAVETAKAASPSKPAAVDPLAALGLN